MKHFSYGFVCMVAAAIASLFTTTAHAQAPCLAGRRVVGYYIEWGIYARSYMPADIPADKITHLNYAFANVGPDLRIAQGDSYAATDRYYPGDTSTQPFRGNYHQINDIIKAAHPHLKTLISVGGWNGSARFSDVALTASSRSVFAHSCVDFIRQYHFNGVDIDWEFPVAGGLASNIYRPTDGHNYTLLLAALRAALDAAGTQDGTHYLLTIAAPAGYDTIAHFETAATGQYVDWINVMCYDFFGPSDLSATGHHAGFEANPARPGNTLQRDRYNGRYAMEAWMTGGVPASKLVMGTAFYGLGWRGVPNVNHGLFQPATGVAPGTWDDSGPTGVNDYSQLVQFMASGGYTRYWDSAAQAPYLYNPTANGGHFISYDDPQSLGVKTAYIVRRGLGGAMIWELSGDRSQAMLNALDSGLGLNADYNNDGDIGTDQDIEAFFACLAGNCCATCPASADFNGDGDVGTDQDIEAFFRVLAGGAC